MCMVLLWLLIALNSHQQCWASSAQHISDPGETRAAANPRHSYSPSSFACLTPQQLSCNVFGLFTFWIMSTDLHISMLGSAVDICKSKSTLSFAWGVFFSFGFTAAFPPPPLRMEECDPKPRTDLSVFRPKEVLV